MRSLAYREFIYMVYGCVDKTRIPLPACAHDANFKQKKRAKTLLDL